MAPVGKSWKELMDEAASAPSTAFKILDEGDYAFFIKDATAQKAKDGVKDQIIVMAAVESGERRNATVRHQMTLSPESPMALQIFFRELGIFGLGEDFFAQNANMDMNFIASQLKNRRFSASVVHAKSGDKVFANLKNIAEAAGPAPQAGVPGAVAPQAPQAQAQAPGNMQAPPAYTPPPQGQVPNMPPQNGGGWGAPPPPPPTI